MKRKPRMLLALFLAVAVALSSTACGEKDDGPIDPDRTGALLTTVYPGIYEWGDKISANAYSRQSIRWDREYADSLLKEYLGNASEYLVQNTQDAQGERKNAVCTPMGDFLLYAMLAEMTDGKARQELMAAVQCDDAGQLRTMGQQMFYQNFCCNRYVTTQFIDSLWLDLPVAFREETVRRLTENYYATVWRDELGPENSDRLVGACFEDNANPNFDPKGVHFSLEAPLSVTQTLSLTNQWCKSFVGISVPGDFKRGDSGTVQAEYLYLTNEFQFYLDTERYSVSQIDLFDRTPLFFLLPKEGVSCEELLEDPELLYQLFRTGGRYNEERKVGKVTFQMPKFTLSAERDLKSGAKMAGVEAVFERGANFSPLTATDGVFLANLERNMTLRVDENGINCDEAEEHDGETGMLEREGACLMILDRPFIVLRQGESGLPVFVGVVNEPD